MTRVEEIKVAISQLSLSERGQLEKWLHDWKDDEWDQQIAKDAAAGKLDKLLGQVDQEIDHDERRDLRR